MPCPDCSKKTATVICPDPWKSGARNTAEGGGRKLNENKLLSKKSRFTPYGDKKCKTCRGMLHEDGIYCHACSYKKGICNMCGKKILEDMSLYKQSAK